jgi:protein SCO1
MNKSLYIIVFSAGCMLSLVYYLGNPKSKYALPFYQYNSNTQKIEQFISPAKNFKKIREFSAIDQNGQQYLSGNLKGKTYVVDYFFVTCPGICKKMGIQMQRLYHMYEKEEQIVLVSFTSLPEEDSIPVLHDYGKKMKIHNSEKWKLLWSNRKELHDLAKNEFGLLNENDDESDFVHTEKFALIDKNGYIRGYYDGTSAIETDRLMRDINLIKKEEI